MILFLKSSLRNNPEFEKKLKDCKEIKDIWEYLKDLKEIFRIKMFNPNI